VAETIVLIVTVWGQCQSCNTGHRRYDRHVRRVVHRVHEWSRGKQRNTRDRGHAILLEPRHGHAAVALTDEPLTGLLLSHAELQSLRSPGLLKPASATVRVQPRSYRGERSTCAVGIARSFCGGGHHFCGTNARSEVPVEVRKVCDTSAARSEKYVVVRRSSCGLARVRPHCMDPTRRVKVHGGPRRAINTRSRKLKIERQRSAQLAIRRSKESERDRVALNFNSIDGALKFGRRNINAADTQKHVAFAQ